MLPEPPWRAPLPAALRRGEDDEGLQVLLDRMETVRQVRGHLDHGAGVDEVLAVPDVQRRVSLQGVVDLDLVLRMGALGIRFP